MINEHDVEMCMCILKNLILSKYKYRWVEYMVIIDGEMGGTSNDIRYVDFTEIQMESTEI